MLRALALIALTCSLANAQGQTTDGSRSLVPRATLAKVRKSKFRVLVPSYVPTGFKLERAGLESWAEDGPDPLLKNWVIRYKNSTTGGVIVVQMASDGLGDFLFTLPNGDTVEPTGILRGKSPVFGSYEIGSVKKGAYRSAALNWVEVAKRTLPKHAMVYGEGVDGATVKRVIDGIRWLK